MLEPDALLDDVCCDDPQRTAAALQAATGRGEELGPRIVARFEAVLAKATADPESEAPYLGFMFLLAAEFRLTAAHAPMCAILRLKPEQVDAILGDALTGGIDCALAQTYAGDLAPLLGLVEATAADVFARGCALDAFARLWKRGHIDREYLLSLLSRLADGLNADSPADVEFADRIMEVAVHAQTFEIREKILDLYNRDLANPFYYEPEYTEKALRPGAEPACEVYDLGRVIETAWDEVRHWHYFSPDHKTAGADAFDDACSDAAPELPERLPTSPDHMPWSPPEPYRAPPKIGRNDPCPCGSGKKYKKCCGK